MRQYPNKVLPQFYHIIHRNIEKMGLKIMPDYKKGETTYITEQFSQNLPSDAYRSGR